MTDKQIEAIKRLLENNAAARDEYSNKGQMSTVNALCCEYSGMIKIAAALGGFHIEKEGWFMWNDRGEAVKIAE